MKKVTDAILFGNGFNMLGPISLSWDGLLSKISRKEVNPILNGIPPTLQYEQVYLSPKSTKDYANEQEEEHSLKQMVKRNISKLPINEYYKLLHSLDVDVFLTTNYDHAFFNSDKKCIIDYDGTEKLYSIRRWKKLSIDNREKLLYFIHGDIKGVSSIMLGLDHYGGALAKIQDYVKGKYQRIRDINKDRYIPPVIPSIRERLRKGLSLNPQDYDIKDSGYQLMSWIDAFFFCNLHIIGLSLDFSEIDIWWLLSRRARLLRSNKIHNKIFYYPTFPLSTIQSHLPKLRLMERLGVTIIHHNIMTDIESETPNFPAIYALQIQQLRNNLNILKR